MKLEVLVFGSLLGLRLRLFVFGLVLETSGDLFDQTRKILWRLGSNGFHVSLEYEKVAGLDQDVFSLKRLVILLCGNNAVVDSVFASALIRNGSLPFLFLARVIFVNSHDPSSLWITARGFIIAVAICVPVGLRRAIVVDLGCFQNSAAVDEVLKMGGT